MIDLRSGASWRGRAHAFILLASIVVICAAVICPAWSSRDEAAAATLPPPLLDITRQCETIAHRNVTAMSECVVAESEARAEILQKWGKLANADVDRCVKLGRKARKFPYSTMAKCLTTDAADVRTTSAVPVAR